MIIKIHYLIFFSPAMLAFCASIDYGLCLVARTNLLCPIFSLIIITFRARYLCYWMSRIIPLNNIHSLMVHRIICFSRTFFSPDCMTFNMLPHFGQNFINKEKNYSIYKSFYN